MWRGISLTASLFPGAITATPNRMKESTASLDRMANRINSCRAQLSPWRILPVPEQASRFVPVATPRGRGKDSDTVAQSNSSCRVQHGAHCHSGGRRERSCRATVDPSNCRPGHMVETCRACPLARQLATLLPRATVDPGTHHPLAGDLEH